MQICTTTVPHPWYVTFSLQSRLATSSQAICAGPEGSKPSQAKRPSASPSDARSGLAQRIERHSETRGPSSRRTSRARAKTDHNSTMNCVKGEIHNVLSMMRVNALWASVDRFKEEIPAATQSPMLRAFKQLHYELQSVTDLSDVDTVTYLLPFVMVIESERTSGFITGAAIASLNKFLLYGLITSESLRADVAINRIAVCVARCRFEETHRADDEAVLMKLLELVEYCLRSDAGHLISNDNVWKMVQLCYSISCQPRSSLHLRRAAENTLSHLILTVFDRIEDFEPTSNKAALSPSKTATVPHRHDANENSARDAKEMTDKEKNASREQDENPDASAPSKPVLTLPSTPAVAPTKGVSAPYGIPVLERILHFLAGLVSPMENDEATCVLGLRLINIVLETAGTGLGNHPCLVSVLQGDLSKFLLQNSETDDLGVLSLTLRVVFNLFNSIKDHLKVQLEVFFTSVHMRIIDSPSCSDEQKELALESLLEFCREPALMLDLYINYDCDVHCTNLFEVLCKSLARNCDAMATTDVGLNALTLLCFEGLLAVIESIARRCPLNAPGSGAPKNPATEILSLKGSDLARYTSGEMTANTRGMKAMTASFDSTSSLEFPLDDVSPMSSMRDLMHMIMSGSESDSDSEHGEPNDPEQLAWLHSARERTAEVLQQRKREKKRYALAAEKFNTDQKGWIAFSQEIGLLPDTLTPDSVASFLLHTPGLNKTLIGDYIGDGPPEKYPFNTAVRDAYVEMIDFREASSLDEALRIFLAKFRLPGEAQKIDRMMEAFSKQYHAQVGSAGPLADADAAYVLAFSIIMLNTDLHSDHIAKKMTVEEFVRNNRGINDGKDLPEEYLSDLYYNILEHEIQMQHDVSDFMDSGFSTVDRYSTQWEGVLKRSENVVGASFTSNASILKLRAGLYEKDMFTLIADRTIQSLLLAFEKTLDVTNMERALEGLSNCAKIALYYDMTEIFDRVMSSLSSYFLAFAHGILNGEKVYLPPSSGTNVKARAAGASSSSGKNVRQSSPPSSSESVASGGTNESEVFSGATGIGSIEEDRIHGSKTRRALLSLKLLFQFVQNRNESFRKAWTNVIECLLMFNELDAVPISLVEIDDFVDSRGVPLPPVLGGSSAAQTLYSVSSSTPTSVALSPTNSGSSNNAAGLSGKTRERSRRLAERQAAIRSRMKNMNQSNHGGGGASSASYHSSSSGSLWDSLSSYLWAEEEKEDETFSLISKILRDAVSKLGGGLLEKENWLRMARKLPEKSLITLLETLLACRDPFKCILQPSNYSSVDAMMQENAILVLELSVDIILVNSHRILALNLWEPFHMYAKRILSTPLNELHMQGLVERVVVHTLRVSIRLFHDEKIRPKLMATLELLLTIDEDMCKALSDRLASGINMLLKANLVYMHDFHDWSVLLGVLENVVQHKNGRAACWESVTLLADGGHLNDENVTLWMAICLRFVRHRTPYSVDALRLLQGLASSDSSYKMDGKTWLEVMRVMLSYLNDDRAPIAKTAWECLYKSLLLPGVPVAKDMWKECFEHVIFPFDDQVNEGVWNHSKDAALYSVTLLSKTFLHNLNVLMELPEFGTLWLNVLERLAKKLVIPTSASPPPNTVVVYETTLQSLYNLLLVLKAEDVLERVSNEATGQTLFEESCAVIDAVCPHVKEQLGLVPEEELPAEAAAVEATEEGIDPANPPATESEVDAAQIGSANVQVETEKQETVTPTAADFSETHQEAVEVAAAPAERRPSPGTWRTTLETVVVADGSVGVKVDEVILDEITEAV